MPRPSSTSSALLVIILIVTFPVWFSIAAVLFGLSAGLFGLLIGLFAGLFGLIIGILAFPFHLLFGWADWHPFHFHGFLSNGLFYVAVIALVVLVVKRK